MKKCQLCGKKAKLSKVYLAKNVIEWWCVDCQNDEVTSFSYHSQYFDENEPKMQRLGDMGKP